MRLISSHKPRKKIVGAGEQAAETFTAPNQELAGAFVD